MEREMFDALMEAREALRNSIPKMNHHRWAKDRHARVLGKVTGVLDRYRQGLPA